MTTRDRYVAAVGTTAAVFLLYLVTLSPSAALWDAGEYIAAAKSLGVPHQPGNPLFVLIAHVAGLVPLSADYAVRINILAALASAATAGLWFLCAERVLRVRIAHDGLRTAASAVSALLGATAFTVWNQSVVMEKVYPLSLAALALNSWLLIKWLDAEGRSADRLLLLIAYIVGLGYAVHPAGLLTAPAAAVAVMRHQPRTLLRWRLHALLVGAFILGASPFAMIPIRSAHQPFVNVSAVSACENGALETSCTFSAETARRLIGTIQREQYGGNAVTVRRGPFVAQVQMYWLYFKWQWFRDLPGRLPFTQSFIAVAMMGLGIVGLLSLRKNVNGAEREPDTHLYYFGALAATFTVALIYYLNFRYGWSQSPELGTTVEREPRDRDYFYMWTFSLWGLLAGLGVVKLARARTPLLIASLAVIAALPIASNYTTASRRGQSFTDAWAKDVLSSVEPNGVIVTNGDNDSFPLWYAQEVLGVRRDVTVALTPYLDMDWYARQLNRRSRVWNLTDQELDTVPPYLELRGPMQFLHGGISAAVQPGYITRGELLMLRAIKDSFPSRPIYFAAGSYPRRLGLGPYLKRVGLVEKLEPQSVREGPDTVRLDSGYMDVTQSLRLWRQYAGGRQMIAEGRWVDIASVGVPLYYAVVGQDLATALDKQGRSAEAKEVFDLARRVVEATR